MKEKKVIVQYGNGHTLTIADPENVKVIVPGQQNPAVLNINQNTIGHIMGFMKKKR